MTEQNGEIRVKELMSRDVVTVGPSDTLHDAMQLLVENRVAALPVVNSRDQCVGMLSTSDLIEVTQELDDEVHNLGRTDSTNPPWLIQRLADCLGSELVSEQMSTDVAVVGPDARLSEAAATMLRNRVHRLPVLDESLRLRGIISTMDIMGVVAQGRFAQPCAD
ncbi:MAG: CBS domain-containing protein [Pirellulaceae bacterium]|jgi:CBS domain-containing protein|nr:CBS domain-containing protein [Pirellulaceae bacterium]MDP7019948.1 CBS domain-containing protein [Pirellulaceae bacterium]